MSSLQKNKCLGSDALIRTLEAEGVEYIFGYPGGAIMPVYDALMREPHSMNHILVRHEQGAIHAAQGYTRSHPESKPGICMVTSGPGATNLITGLADAIIDNTPLVCITGQVAASLLGTDAFQETDIISLSAPVTKWSIRVEKAEDISPAISKAFYIAQSGKPGPVLVDITKNAQTESCDFSYTKTTSYPRYSPIKKNFTVAKNLLEEAAVLINEAERPFIIVGQGVTIAGAEDELVTLIEKTSFPTACTLLGLSALPRTHRLHKGMLGMHGNVAPNILTQQCDVLIAIGMRFDDRVTSNTSGYARQAKIIHLNIDPSEINKAITCHVALVGDCKQTMKDLLPLINREKEHDEWEKSFAIWQTEEQEKVIDPILFSKKEAIKMGEVVEKINSSLKKDATIVTDVGQHQMIAGRYFNFSSPKSQITSGGLGTMGFGLPAALGAALGNPKKTTIAILGDGGIQMTIQELGTIAQLQLPVKIIILNNNFLGMVRQWQELFFESRYSYTNLENPNFIKIGEAYGIDSIYIDSKEKLHEALPDVLSNDKPALVEIVIEKEENVYPIVPSGANLEDIVISPPNMKE